MLNGMYTAWENTEKCEPLLGITEGINDEYSSYAVVSQQYGGIGEESTLTLSDGEVKDHLGNRMLQTVGAAEIPIQEALSESPEETTNAIEKEMNANNYAHITQIITKN